MQMFLLTSYPNKLAIGGIRFFWYYRSQKTAAYQCSVSKGQRRLRFGVYRDLFVYLSCVVMVIMCYLDGLIFLGNAVGVFRGAIALECFTGPVVSADSYFTNITLLIAFNIRDCSVIDKGHRLRFWFVNFSISRFRIHYSVDHCHERFLVQGISI